MELGSDEEEDTQVKVYWKDYSEYFIEDWIRTKSDMFRYISESYPPTRPEGTANVMTNINERPWLAPGAEISDWFNFGEG
jgi:hypothetical protein